ncbi:MAG TPA: M15 family metallopeptidase [Cyclobacteriaceae bacterium]|nr:M15 family metallopeptidase [Cyclobacteriaceae bacterium]
MKRSVLNLLLILMIAACSTSSTEYRYPYGLQPANTLAAYQQQVKDNPENELIDLEYFIPGIVLDIRYATTNNFTAEQIYQLPKAFARKPVAEALLKIQQALQADGLGLKIYDAYRPYAATVKFYEVYHDTTYVASPYRGSRHNRGCAVDLTLIQLDTGEELKMPTSYDSFEEMAHADYPLQDEEALRNRELLKAIMQQHGFKVYAAEWWHYDFIGWENFELLDIPFEVLIK